MFIKACRIDRITQKFKHINGFFGECDIILVCKATVTGICSYLGIIPLGEVTHHDLFYRQTFLFCIRKLLF